MRGVMGASCKGRLQVRIDQSSDRAARELCCSSSPNLAPPPRWREADMSAMLSYRFDTFCWREHGCAESALSCGRFGLRGIGVKQAIS